MSWLSGGAVKRGLTSVLWALAWVTPVESSFAQPDVAHSSIAQRKSGGAALGFSNLVYRVHDDEDIGIAEEDYRVYILEALRDVGFNAVGAENLVFGEDRGRQAEFLLGGTVREFKCIPVQSWVNCRVGVEWQLMRVADQHIVYTVLSRALETKITKQTTGTLGKRLILKALGSLTTRKRFRSILAESQSNRNSKPGALHEVATLATCKTSPQAMPEGADATLNATAVVESSEGFGSAFFVTRDGLLLTAAHVVESNELTVHTREGTQYQASVVRKSERHDVALLRVVQSEAVPREGWRCLPLADTPPGVGSEVYALGSPASQELAFSVTRGIVSGSRTIDGVDFLQTDTSVSPGNSGGPLVDASGRVIGVVSWKVVGESVEGIAFGVPIAPALGALGLKPGLITSHGLLRNTGTPVHAPKKRVAFEDKPDNMPQLRTGTLGVYAGTNLASSDDRPLSPSQQESKIAQEIEQRTPTYVDVMKYGGMGAVATGAVVIVYSYANFGWGEHTPASYESNRLANDIGWVLLGLGGASWLSAYLLKPRLTEAEKRKVLTGSNNDWELRLGPGSASVLLRY